MAADEQGKFWYRNCDRGAICNIECNFSATSAVKLKGTISFLMPSCHFCERGQFCGQQCKQSQFLHVCVCVGVGGGG